MVEGSSVDADERLFCRLADIPNEPHCWLLPIEGHETMPLVTLEIAMEYVSGIVPDIQRKVYVAKQICRNPADNLYPDESAAIMIYTMDWAPANKYALKPWHSYLKLFLTALDKLPSISCIVYRGVKMNMVDKYLQNRDVIWWGFSSCTTNINALRSERYLGKTGDRTLFSIKCNSGEDIKGHSYYGHENEILLPPARFFKVVGHLDHGNGLYMIQLEETACDINLIELVATSTRKPETPRPTIRRAASISINYENSKLVNQIKGYGASGRINLTFQNLIDRDIPIIMNEAIIDKSCVELDLSDNN